MASVDGHLTERPWWVATISSRLVLPDLGLIDQEMHGREGKHFTIGGQEQPVHVLAFGLQIRVSRAGERRAKAKAAILLD